MTKIDMKKQLKHLYNASKTTFGIVDVPPLNFLMIDGHGDPNTAPAYQEAVEALYAVAYGLRFRVKRGHGIDYGVLPLEGLWWVKNMAEFSAETKDDWDWTMMIMQPEWVTTELVAQVCADVGQKKDPPALPKMRYETYHEGLAVQTLYIGPYADEAPTIARLHAFAENAGYALRGKHHEIYLTDPRRTAPEKLKTVIRQPIQQRA